MAINFFKEENRIHNSFYNHTYEPNLITEGGWALDLGCNDFIMTGHLLGMGLKVIAIDPIKTIHIPEIILNDPNFIYLQKIKNLYVILFYCLYFYMGVTISFVLVTI